MPFPEQDPKPFTREHILRISGTPRGVFGLYQGNTCIYIGRGDIRTELLRYHNGENPCITREAPTHWVDVVTTDHANRERNLIVELDPVCNRRVG